MAAFITRSILVSIPTEVALVPIRVNHLKTSDSRLYDFWQGLRHYPSARNLFIQSIHTDPLMSPGMDSR